MERDTKERIKQGAIQYYRTMTNEVDCMSFDGEAGKCRILGYDLKEFPCPPECPYYTRKEFNIYENREAYEGD